MPHSNSFERLASDPIGANLLPHLVDAALRIDERTAFLQELIETVDEHVPSIDAAGIVRGIKGTWRTVAATRGFEGYDPELLADSLDSEQFLSAGAWAVTPLDRPNPDGLLVVARFVDDQPISGPVDSIAAAISMVNQIYRQRMLPRQRAERLAAMLEMTAQWNRTRETDELLEEIAQTSTRLLNAERATIFLLDSAGQNLIGQPALGVEGGRLTLPLGGGVVGDVVQTGEPRRVDSDIAAEQRQIDRQVDQQLNFETRSLLCVPLVNSKGTLIGAFELINKIDGNFTDEDQAALIELAEHSALAIENTRHVENLQTTRRVAVDEAAGQVQLIGQCPQIVQLKQTIERVADTDLAILITGENGTGKEVVAQLIHYLSSRRDEVLVAVNCAAITESLLESELFGHEKGAFTDAHQARAGKFELADRGTLFLDEIGDMSLGGQAKLLRVLEEKVVVRVGGSNPITTGARVVAATNQNLAELVQERRFREDLFFRLNVVTIELPPLRDRGDDILQLAQHFLGEFCVKARRDVPQLTASARKRLLGHNWPGNVRELRNMMERLAYLSAGDKIEADDLAFVTSPRGKDSGISLDQTLAEATRNFQIDFIQRHVDRAGGNMTDAAARLGLHRSNLYRKMRQLEMDSGDGEDLG